jgi:hypothetical protein
MKDRAGLATAVLLASYFVGKRILLWLASPIKP